MPALDIVQRLPSKAKCVKVANPELPMESASESEGKHQKPQCSPKYMPYTFPSY